MSKFKPNGITPIIPERSLRAFVQTVLPTIYDDSLSYYELLSKVVKHLNSIADNFNILSENQRLFIEQFTTYANDVLATKDEVQNAIAESKQYTDTKAQEIYSYTDTKVQEIYSYTDGHLNTLSQYVNSEVGELSEYFEQKLDEIRDKLSFAFAYNVNTNELSEDAKDIVAAIGKDKVTYCIVKDNGKDDIYCYYSNSSFDSNNDETLHFAGEIIEAGVAVGKKVVSVNASNENVTITNMDYSDTDRIGFVDFRVTVGQNNQFNITSASMTPREAHAAYVDSLVTVGENKLFSGRMIESFSDEILALSTNIIPSHEVTIDVAPGDTGLITFKFYLNIFATSYALLSIYGQESTNTWSTEYHYEESNRILPRVTSADNGKFLMVSNGAWSAESVPSAESEVF